MKLFEGLFINNFEKVKFQDYAVFVRGLTYKKSEETQDLDGTPIIRADNILLNNSNLDLSNMKLINKNVNIPDNKKASKDDILMCISSGSKTHVGKIAYVNEDLNIPFGGFIAAIRTKSKLLNNKYLYYVLNSNIFKDHLSFSLNSTTINNINSHIINTLSFPLPPLELQNKIVEILDKFTEYSAELKAELKARDEQYRFYRDKLLSNNNLSNDINFFSKKLSEIAEINIGKQPSKEDISENGLYPYMNGGINKSSNAKNFNNIKNTIIVSQGGSNAGYVQWMYEDFYQGSHCYSLKVTSKQILNRFLFFYLKSNQDKIFNLVQGSGIPGLKKTSLSSLTVLIPSIRTQEKIVKVLDNFESICKDLNIGLPAEEAKRQQQYEYYRDAIFKYLETGIIDNKGIGERERERESGLIKIIEFIFNKTIYLIAKLSNCAQMSSGQFIKAQDRSEEFIYPFYNGGRNNSGYHNEYNREGENILISIRGVNAGATNYINDKFWLGNSCVSIQTNKEFDPLFIYFYLTNNINSLLISKDDGAIPAISMTDIRNIDIPIIPLHKQKEISTKIKSFYEFVNDLKLGLPKLIQLTQIQYEYYRDGIFKFLENKSNNTVK
ncbi:restriction endonuclease subunit S [Mycoplasmopsis gallinacea]|uniref:Type I restriction modification DNA specificity domain-containing protein n=1 Tax=Mycoplasmopsis gallinacea TaxID=29556 RepID=A0A6H0V3H7_9BACT|nr:restriction endonuclease subunit S [Mycoplasmopsis gallinacea]QIW62249.1 hypothetical protein GOQ20_02250 [Mycoplasmopsis gallinacea]